MRFAPPRLLLWGLAGLLVGGLAGWLAEPSVTIPDQAGYLVTTRSLLRDGDLDFRNDYPALGVPPFYSFPTPAGYRENLYAPGSGLIWLPAAWAADRLAGADPAGRDRTVAAAASATSILAVAVGLVLLARLLRREDPEGAIFLTVALLLGSPLLYYGWMEPLMSHGPAFGLVTAAVLLWLRLRDEAERDGSTGAPWLLLGALIGAAGLIRTQLLSLLLLPLADPILGTFRRGIRPFLRPLTLLGIGCLGVFSFQLAAWTAIFGDPLAAPESINLAGGPIQAHRVLLSGYHGLLTWTPLLGLGLLGLGLGVYRRDRRSGPALAFVILQVLLAGSTLLWWGGRTFGPRLLVCCVPLLALGLARLRRELGWRPFLMAALPCLLWTVGLLGAVRAGSLDLAFPYRTAELAGPFLSGWRGWVQAGLDGAGRLPRGGSGGAAAALAVGGIGLLAGLGLGLPARSTGFRVAGPALIVGAVLLSGIVLWSPPRPDPVPPGAEEFQDAVRNRIQGIAQHQMGDYWLHRGRPDRALPLYQAARDRFGPTPALELAIQRTRAALDP